MGPALKPKETQEIHTETRMSEGFVKAGIFYAVVSGVAIGVSKGI